MVTHWRTFKNSIVQFFLCKGFKCEECVAIFRQIPELFVNPIYEICAEERELEHVIITLNWFAQGTYSCTWNGVHVKMETKAVRRNIVIVSGVISNLYYHGSIKDIYTKHSLLTQSICLSKRCLDFNDVKV